MTAPGGKRRAGAVLAAIIKLLETASSIVLFAMMVLTFVDVVGRYLIGSPIFGASEMISTMLALVIFSGLGIANARDQHIVVELFDTRIRRFSPGAYDTLVHGFSLLAMALIVFVLLEQAVDAYRQDARTVVLEWPLAWITGIVAALAALSIVSQVLGLMTGAFKRPEHQLEPEQHLEDL